MAKLALILGMILTALTIIEKVLVIHEKVKKLKTKRKRPARRKRKWFWAEERSAPSLFYIHYNNLPICKQYEENKWFIKLLNYFCYTVLLFLFSRFSWNRYFKNRFGYLANYSFGSLYYKYVISTLWHF